MKTLIHVSAILFVSLGVALGQGSVSWISPTSLVTWQTNSTTYSPLFGGGSTGSGTVGFIGGTIPGPNYRFQLLYGSEYDGSVVSPPSTLAQLNSWSDSGLTATNTGAFNGRITPSPVSTGATTPAGFNGGHFYNVILVGWSANLGNTWSQAKNNLNNFAYAGISSPAYFGVTGVAIIAPNNAGVNPGAVIFGTSTNGVPKQLFAPNTQLYLVADPLLIYDNAQLPVITQQPQSQTLNAGLSASFSVAVTNNPPFFYQWYKNRSVLTNATNATLTINPVAPNDAGNYSVSVRNTYGYRPVYSSNATLVVNLSYPVITAHPQSQTLAAGSSLSLSVQATNNPPFSYQWYFNNIALPGETNSTLAYNPTYTNDSGSYRVTVSNAYGSANSSNATVFVYHPASLITPLANQIVSYGDAATFSVGADGFPAPTFRWSFNGSPIAFSNSSSLLIPGVTTNKLGTYSVTVSNAYGFASSSATLTMRPSLVIPFTGINGLWGQPGTLSVSAVGSGTLAYQWYLNGTAISGANASTYYISSLQFTNAGSYSVVVSSANWADFSTDFRNNQGKYYRVIPAP